MEDVLDLYAEPYDPHRPVVCFDETSTQLLAEVRAPQPVWPGRPRRQDYEYRRAGTRNLFLTCEPLAGWRHVASTERRTMEDCPASTIFAGWRQSVLPVHLLGLDALLGSVGPVAGDVKLQDDGVVHDPVNRHGGGHGVGKDALPLREDQV